MCWIFLNSWWNYSHSCVSWIFHITVVKLIEIHTHPFLDMLKCYQTLLAALVSAWTLICKIIDTTYLYLIWNVIWTILWHSIWVWLLGEALYITILTGKTVFHSIQYKTGRLAVSNLFHMFTQSNKFYTLYYHVLRAQMFEKCDSLNIQ